MTMTTMKLTRHESDRLARLRDRLNKELADLELAGLEERAAKVRAEHDQVQARLDASQEAYQEEESRRRAQERRQKEAQEARRKAEEQAREEARAFLENLRFPMALDEFMDAAETAGIGRSALLGAAEKLELRSLGRLQRGTTSTAAGRTHIGRPGLLAGGMIDAGPVRLPDPRPAGLPS